MEQIEIERKWLVEPGIISLDMFAKKYIKIRQHYIQYHNPEIRIRDEEGEKFSLTFKSELQTPIARRELNIEITEQEYNAFSARTKGFEICKKRYCKLFDETNYKLMVDVFEGNLEGLIIAEVEFPDKKEAENFEPLRWFGKEVTGDLMFRNVNLSKVHRLFKRHLDDGNFEWVAEYEKPFSSSWVDSK